MSRLLVIAAGGTGGHMFPAQALAEEMLRRGWRVKLSTDTRGARYAGGFPAAVERNVVGSATFARGGVLAKLAVPLRIAGGVVAAVARMLRERPAVVVGFGGYPAIPAMTAAYALRVPRMLHEQNGVLGRVNQVFARRVDRVACGTWPTELPSGVEGVHVGNPVRGAILAAAGATYPAFEGRVRLLVLGGSQGARILSDVVPGALADLPEVLKAGLEVSHQARAEDVARVEAFYNEAGITAQVKTFFDDVPERLSAAHLLIARSGASTVADATVIGRPAIFVPLAQAIRDEQTANARQMVEAGAALLAPEAGLSAASLAAQISEILSDADTARAMAKAALDCGRPDATARLAELVEKLAEGRNE